MRIYINNNVDKTGIYNLFGIPVKLNELISKDDISLSSVIDRVHVVFPKYIANTIKSSSLLSSIEVGNFEILNKKYMQALYDNNVMYVSNEPYNETYMSEDIMHEMFHILEKIYNANIYSDGQLIREFLVKRQQLLNMLESSLIGNQTVFQMFGNEWSQMRKLFFDANYSNDFDNLLLNDIGYECLNYFVPYIFADVYSATSVREYFVSGCEQFYFKDVADLKRSSPILYKKIKQIDALMLQNQQGNSALSEF